LRRFATSKFYFETNCAIVRAIIGLGNALHLPVIAEGVETASEHEFLVRESCCEIEGYLIGRPQPIGFYSDLTSGIAAGKSGNIMVG
jgi:EAL domain-containing protein (putative c-di-GMP-specific phosphodiesterase class I)